MSARRSQTATLAAALFVALGASSALRVPTGIGPGSDSSVDPHPGFAVKNFDSRWIPVTPRDREILRTLRELRLETSTMWFRIDCNGPIYERNEIELVYEGGTVWVAAGQPRPSAPPVVCLEQNGL